MTYVIYVLLVKIMSGIRDCRVGLLPLLDEELRFRELIMDEAAGIQVLHHSSPLPVS